MIVLTRLNGPSFALNPDLIERADANPDTVITLVGGVKYVIGESLEELVERIRDFRGQVIASAQAAEMVVPPKRSLRVISGSDAAADLHQPNGV